MTLTKEARDAIARAVQRLRALFEGEYSQQASGRFGLHADGRTPLAGEDDSGAPDESSLRPWIEPPDALVLTPSQLRQRRELVGAVSYLQREGVSPGDAIARIIREGAFTSTNQLIAVRVAEATGVLPEVIANGRQSSSYREITRDLFPIIVQDEDEGYWTYVQMCGDELGASVPLLFDRRHPTSAFVPSRACIDEALTIINAPDVAEAWTEPEALGWAYQFFNGDESERMRKASPQAPRNSRELAIRNQFFTPRYVVDWLVQNTLGRRLRDGGIEVDLPLLVGEPGEPAHIDLAEIRVLDPAVGSGHFLLGCYDLLERAWQLAGVSPAEAAPRILRSLHGVEIDPRASQVAQAVLVLRAKRAAPGESLEPPLIVTARPLPGAPKVRARVFEALTQNARDLAIELDDALADARTLGSLLKIEQRMKAALERALRTPKLSEDVSAEYLEEELVRAIDEVTDTADASPAARLFAADARDAIRLLELCQHRYDVVLMNPPFGEPVPSTRDYLRAAYGSSSIDIYAAFVARGVELLADNGYLGAITSRTGFFMITFEEWRTELVLPRLRAMLDLGVGVMHSAMVEAAAYVLSADQHHGEAGFRRLLRITDKATAVYEGTGETYVRRPDDFRHIPGSPAAYWLTPAILTAFRNRPTLKNVTGIDVRQGLATADDFRFVRLWWEVPVGELGRERRWVPFAKGGEYSPYYADLRLVVDWERSGQRIVDWGQGRVQNTQHYFRPGLTWSLRSQKGFSVRPVPRDSIFGHKGPMLFVESDSPADLDRVMAYLNSSAAGALIETMVAFGAYEVGAVQRLPHLDAGEDAGNVAADLTLRRMRDAECLELDHLFVSPWTQYPTNDVAVSKLSTTIDDSVTNSLGETRSTEPLSAMYPTRWFEEDYKPPSTPSAHHEISYLVGGAFGRWDIRLANGTNDPPPLPGAYDALPRAARGMLVDSHGDPALSSPKGYDLQIPPDRLLHDEPGHARDIVTAIEAVAEGISSGPLPPTFAFNDSIRDLRQHLRTRFFVEHLKDYSAPRRTAPIYWYLSIPSREWGIWMYAPALSREMLFAIAHAARDRFRRASEQARQFRLQHGDDVARETVRRMEQLELLITELEVFAEQAETLAQSGWEPDLNDGLILCAAPFETLFADEGWRGRVATVRKDMENGSYPWASVQSTFVGGTS